MQRNNVETTDDDNDGYFNGDDVFPLDPTEWADFDEDGLGDNADINDDNDGSEFWRGTATPTTNFRFR